MMLGRLPPRRLPPIRILPPIWRRGVLPTILVRWVPRGGHRMKISEVGAYVLLCVLCLRAPLLQPISDGVPGAKPPRFEFLG